MWFITNNNIQNTMKPMRIQKLILFECIRCDRRVQTQIVKQLSMWRLLSWIQIKRRELQRCTKIVYSVSWSLKLHENDLFCCRFHLNAEKVRLTKMCITVILFFHIAVSTCTVDRVSNKSKQMSQCMRFPTIWYVRPAKPQISQRIRAV